MLARLPTDVLITLLGHCDSPSLGAVGTCSVGLREAASDAEIWRALLRKRHRSLIGEMDPLMSLLPSAALREGSESSERSHSPSRRHTNSWQQLYACYDREWLSVPQPHHPHFSRSNAFAEYWAMAFAQRERSRLLSLPVLLRLALMGFGPAWLAGAFVGGCAFLLTAGVTHLVSSACWGGQSPPVILPPWSW